MALFPAGSYRTTASTKLPTEIDIPANLQGPHQPMIMNSFRLLQQQVLWTEDLPPAEVSEKSPLDLESFTDRTPFWLVVEFFRGIETTSSALSARSISRGFRVEHSCLESATFCTSRPQSTLPAEIPAIRLPGVTISRQIGMNGSGRKIGTVFRQQNRQHPPRLRSDYFRTIHGITYHINLDICWLLEFQAYSAWPKRFTSSGALC